MTRALIIGIAILALQGCPSGPSTPCSGGSNLPEKPELCLDRTSLGFGQEFGSGTFVGTEAPQSLQLTNGGQTTLNITSATLSGADAATFTMMGPTSMSLKSNEQTFITLTFKPTASQIYNATLTIVSNADNRPSIALPVSGKGVDITSIRLDPAMPSLQVGHSQQMNAIASFSDTQDGGSSSTLNVNSISTWSSTDPSVANIDAMGNVMANAAASDGGVATTTVSATAHGITGTTVVSVHN